VAGDFTLARMSNGPLGLRRCHRPGFTLLELLLVMMIATILMTLAVPPMLRTVRSTRLENARQDFMGDLRLARMEAIRRNASVTVTRTSSTAYTIDFIGTRSLSEGATFTSGPTTVVFASYGAVPAGGGTFVLGLAGRSATVFVSPAGNAVAR
jgi:prepilin-type N-terminal cleavage/methylation domain-containing protein